MAPNAGLMLAQATAPAGGNGAGDVTQAQFANPVQAGPMFPLQRTQVFFSRPAGMKIHWFTQGKDGKPRYSAFPLEVPGRYDFDQAARYRLKLTFIPGRPGLELYPTLEVVPTGPKTHEFLAHNSVPVEFTEDDFRQVVERNYIIKVIYLPDPQFQDVAGAGPDEINSARLEPGQDPIQEAMRRGSILLVVRIGNIDQGIPGMPPMSGAAPGGTGVPMIPPGPGVPPLFQVPLFGAPPDRPLMPGPQFVPPVPGLGAEAERRKPIVSIPDAGNLPNNPVTVPAKPGGDIPALPANMNGAKDRELFPQVVMPPPAEEIKGPAPEETKTPNPAKIDALPGAKAIEGTPVSNPRSDIPKAFGTETPLPGSKIVPQIEEPKRNGTLPPLPKPALQGQPVSSPRNDGTKGMDLPSLPGSITLPGMEQPKKDVVVPNLPPAAPAQPRMDLPPVGPLNLPPMPGPVAGSQTPMQVLPPPNTSAPILPSSAISPGSVLPPADPAPAPISPRLETTPVSRPNSGTPNTGMPGIELPPFDPDLMTGPGVPAIPLIPPLPQN
jgi:hypothetical protein